MQNRQIKKIRDYFGLSQREFADLLGVTQSKVNHIEQGRTRKIPREWAKVLEKAYFVCEEYTLFGREPMFLFDRDKDKFNFIKGINDIQLKFIYYNFLLNPEKINKLIELSQDLNFQN